MLRSILLRGLAPLFAPDDDPGVGDDAGERTVEEVVPDPPDGEGAGGGVDDHMARSYDDLARRDRELQTRHQRIRQQEQELQELQEIRRLARERPADVLTRLQINPMSISESLFGEGTQQQDQTPSAELAPIREELQELRRWREQREQQDQFHAESRNIQRTIAGGEYDMLQMAVGDHPDQVVREVLQEAHAIYRETGAIPDYGKILGTMEERYTSQAMALIQRLGSAKKVKERLSNMPGSENAPTETQQRGTRTSRARTLTNDLEDSANETRQRLGTDQQGLEERRKAFLSHIPKLFKER